MIRQVIVGVSENFPLLEHAPEMDQIRVWNGPGGMSPAIAEHYVEVPTIVFPGFTALVFHRPQADDIPLPIPLDVGEGVFVCHSLCG